MDAYHNLAVSYDRLTNDVDYRATVEFYYEILKKEGKTAILITHDIAEAISMSERIIVLTKRPGRMKKEFNLHLTMPDGSLPEKPSKARSAVEFAEYYQNIWKELMDDVV